MGPGITPPGPDLLGGVMFGLMGIIWLGALAMWIVFIVAAWKLMRAHERIAQTLRGLAEALRSQGLG